MFTSVLRLFPQARPEPFPGNGDLILTRTLHVPRGRVFRAWTDPRQLARWWGPKDFTNPVCALDPRPGGALSILMRAPDGAEHPMAGVYREVEEPEDLVFVSTAFEDAAGYPRLEVLNTVVFTEQDGATALTLTARILQAAPELAAAVAGMAQGWSQSLDRLQRLLYRGPGPGAHSASF
jgi:uncharacterized protein YndB with AHSA1/START domain